MQLWSTIFINFSSQEDSCLPKIFLYLKIWSSVYKLSQIITCNTSDKVQAKPKLISNNFPNKSQFQIVLKPLKGF